VHPKDVHEQQHTQTTTVFTAFTQVNLRQPAPPVTNWRILLVQSFTAHMRLLMATSIQTGKTLEFSSTVLFAEF